MIPVSEDPDEDSREVSREVPLEEIDILDAENTPEETAAAEKEGAVGGESTEEDSVL